MKIVVTSNCQTGGVALALRQFFPDASVHAIPLPATNIASDSEDIRRELGDADYWITSGKEDMEINKLLASGRLHKIRMPVIGFQAFHPDLCYARKKSTGELTTLHYNSAIGVWGYMRSLSADVVASLFNTTVFAKLGYLDYWVPCKDHLRRVFANSDLTEAEFTRFFLAVQRRGVFMHSINHPKIGALVDLSRLLALRIGYKGNIWDVPVDLPDALSHDLVWPVYPEIGIALGVAGDYTWKIRLEFIDGVTSYLNYAYDGYRRQGIEPNDFEIVGFYHGWNESKLNDVLSQSLESQHEPSL